MSSSFISKISLYLSFILIISCQDTITSLRNNEKIDSVDYTFELEKDEFLDFNLFKQYEDNVIDDYTYNASDYNFLDKNQAILKINNNVSKYNNNNAYSSFVSYYFNSLSTYNI